MNGISIIVPTKNAGSGFDELLDSLYSQNVDSWVEVVVVDSGSTDNTVEIAQKHDVVLVEISPDEFHHAATRNLGAENASGEIIVFTVQDMRPKSGDWLSNLIEPLTDEDIGVTYSRQVAFTDAKPMDEFFYSYFYPDDRKVLTIDTISDGRQFYLNNVYVSNVGSAMRQSVWDEIRFDSDYEMSEDKKFALDALRTGYRLVYTPSAEVFHSHDYTLQSLFQRRFKDGMAYGSIPQNGNDSFFSDGAKYVMAEISYLISNGYPHWVPYAFLYEFIHFVAFQLGKRNEQLSDSIVSPFQ